ncbi:MAG: hypothetical protein R6V13_11940 [Anaerolineae bacterium]
MRRLRGIADAQARGAATCRRRLADGEAEVDERVAELYSLDEDDLAVIEDFLARF